LNYTHIQDLYPDLNISPRSKYCDSRIDNVLGDLCVVGIDSVREREIGVGTSWPFGTLSEGSCLISEQFALKLDFSVGSNFLISMPNAATTLTEIADTYNNFAV
jgi:hypothetical protein